MAGTSSPESVSTKLQQIAELAKQAPEMVLTTLAHHIDMDWMREAHRRTRRDGAVGVDGQTAAEYAVNLDENLQALLGRFKSGTYRAPPVRRVYIPKDGGRGRRPIGIPTLEDKILQRAVTMLLEAVYEQDFRDCSYGFRPGRSAHDALDRVWKVSMQVGGGWVLEVDLESFFDTLGHKHLRRFLDQRVRDGVVRRMIDKWLKAGVLEEGQLSKPKTGTPQGGVISPILANVYLHEVLDKWFEQDVEPRMRGAAHLIRYADDFVMVFAEERDAHRVINVLSKRFAKYGLTINAEKTRLVDFRRPPWNGPRGRGQSFDLLGFNHHWGKSRKGHWIVKRKTAANRLRRTLRAISQWCRRNRHLSLAKQHQALTRKVRGHYQYFGITGNAASLHRFLRSVVRVWRKWLNRRNDHASMPWVKFWRLYRVYRLPPPRIAHSCYVAKP